MIQNRVDFDRWEENLDRAAGLVREAAAHGAQKAAVSIGLDRGCAAVVALPEVIAEPDRKMRRGPGIERWKIGEGGGTVGQKGVIAAAGGV